jgi:hypothetical protein
LITRSIVSSKDRSTFYFGFIFSAFIERPFKDYLESKKLTKNIKHFVQHSIAMATNQTLTAEVRNMY